MVAMKEWNTTFVVPLGVGAHLEYWGVPSNRIVELDWWERAAVHGLEIVATPARHISGRTFGIGDAGTLWAGFAILGRERRASTPATPGCSRASRRSATSSDHST
jgi:L-ascorbate metabolism protein UlaG (beta-lactamase superfamily)